jgi:hypothetical protein
MPGEMDAELRNTLRSLQAQVEGVGRAQKKTTDEVARFHAEAKKAFGAAAKGGDDAEKAGRKGASAWKQFGDILGRVGGPVGELAGKFAGLRPAENALNGLKLAATGVGAVFGMVMVMLERSGQQARANAAAWREMGDAMLAAKTRQGAIGTAGVGQADEQRRLVAAGPEAVAYAKQLAESNTGIDEADANQGVATIYSKYGTGARSRAAVEAARALHQTGAMSYSEAATSLVDYGADLSGPGVARAVAARIYANKTGRVNEDPNESFSDALARTGGDTYLQKSARVTSVNNMTRGAERDQVTSGAAEVSARRQLGETRDPLTAAILAVANEQSRAIQVLERITDGQSRFLEALKHLTTGSAEDDEIRAKNAAGAGADVYQPGG